MTTALLVITDGRRDCIGRSLPSAMANLLQPGADPCPFDAVVVHDDSGDPDYRAWLTDTVLPPIAERVRAVHLIAHPAGRQGFGGAIRNAWSFLTSEVDTDHVFHLEDDFTFNRPVDLYAMAKALDARPDLVQLALRRQPWNEAERAAGGVIEQHPEHYTERGDGLGVWLEHRNFFTTNPSLYRRSLCATLWPDGAFSEGQLTQRLLSDPTTRFGYWGARSDGPWVEHIGSDRVGHGY